MDEEIMDKCKKILMEMESYLDNIELLKIEFSVCLNSINHRGKKIYELIENIINFTREEHKLSIEFEKKSENFKDVVQWARYRRVVKVTEIRIRLALEDLFLFMREKKQFLLNHLESEFQEIFQQFNSELRKLQPLASFYNTLSNQWKQLNIDQQKKERVNFYKNMIAIKAQLLMIFYTFLEFEDSFYIYEYLLAEILFDQNMHKQWISLYQTLCDRQNFVFYFFQTLRDTIESIYLV